MDGASIPADNHPVIKHLKQLQSEGALLASRVACLVAGLVDALWLHLQPVAGEYELFDSELNKSDVTMLGKGMDEHQEAFFASQMGKPST